MLKFYEPSGNFSPVSFLYFLLTSIIVLPLLALIYTYLIWYIPFVYVNLFITIGFGFAVGFAINFMVIKLGKVRNKTLATIFGVLSGLIALYFSWAVWVDLVFNVGEVYGTSRIGIATSNIKFFQVVQLALHPKELFLIIMEINESGTWGFGSTTVSGIFLAIIWIIEALIVLVLSVLAPIGQSTIPFCEHDNKWFKENELPAFNLISNPNEFIGYIENHNSDAFKELTKVPNSGESDHSIFTLYSSKKGENYLSIENKKMKKNSKGETEFDGNEFITYAMITSDFKQILLEK
ncbi:MAG: hypothetical protein ED556_01835 [Winogradskyella sp.]|uniref:hypothetical protein n=1 Tax=Winogradskyella sp. TaxID=1883156 RepID=UPI000F3FDD08|nr:hypothetical protein [Winogradskyella sp.]RNC87953.1 MAG: hypothetical protein ED556_01835 [Winogradskyella sp.]